jgi:hypothetical protein
MDVGAVTDSARAKFRIVERDGGVSERGFSGRPIHERRAVAASSKTTAAGPRLGSMQRARDSSGPWAKFTGIRWNLWV